MKNFWKGAEPHSICLQTDLSPVEEEDFLSERLYFKTLA